MLADCFHLLSKTLSRLTMARQLHLVESETTFGTPRAHISSCAEGTTIVLRVIGDIEFPAGWVLLETLLAAPGHVL